MLNPQNQDQQTLLYKWIPSLRNFQQIDNQLCQALQLQINSLLIRGNKQFYKRITYKKFTDL